MLIRDAELEKGYEVTTLPDQKYNPMSDRTVQMIVELRDMIYRELEVRAEANRHSFQAQEKALELALAALNHRLEGLNGLHAQIATQGLTFSTKSEVDILKVVNDATLLGMKAQVRDLELTKTSRDEVTTQNLVSADKFTALHAAIRQLELSHGALQARLYTISALLGVAMAAASVLLAVFR